MAVLTDKIAVITRGNSEIGPATAKRFPILFAPMQIGNLKLANRIVVAPMGQYSAEDGQMNDWHLMHLGQLAISGAALLTIEGTAVSPEGRTSYADVGLYSDDSEASMARVLLGVRRWSDIPIGIQLNHAGRKGSRQKLWDGGARPAIRVLSFSSIHSS
jgi:2,4-dienoyl-CoA reductase-like NADH-dependent reductase (Old Yellow Enzyme family)